MDITGKKIWQQAAGDTDRNYSGICLKWDVILNGPGYAGPWPNCNEKLKNDGWSSKKRTDLKRFCEDIKDKDVVVLRLGTSKVLGVGLVVGDYDWRKEFSDIDGWDLQHVRRVNWLWTYEETQDKKPNEFPVYTLKQGDTTQELGLEDKNKPITNWISDLKVSEDKYNRKIKELPNCESVTELEYPEISEYLFDNGVASHSIEELKREIDELVRIAKWYKKTKNPSEFETVAYLVVPLLRALGWTPQKMAIEWNKVDIALFNCLPREDHNLAVVVEAKKKDSSCLTALSQARDYAKGKENCRRLIVTDGLRYGVYFKDGEEFSELFSYMNLTSLKSSYPIYECKGAKETLMAMAPEGLELLKSPIDV